MKKGIPLLVKGNPDNFSMWLFAVSTNGAVTHTSEISEFQNFFFVGGNFSHGVNLDRCNSLESIQALRWKFEQFITRFLGSLLWVVPVTISLR
jgi:hypothetical protein